MTLLNTFFYYTCFASIVLFYGIGTNKVLNIDFSKIKSITYCFKIIISIMVSSVVSWFVTKGILVPLKIAELFPLVVFLIYICVDTFLEALIRLTTGKSATEFIFSYLVIILTISESSSIINCILIAVSCLCSFITIIPFIMAFKKRNSDITNSDKIFCRLFLYLALLMLTITVLDIAWINPEVFQ